MGFEALLRIDDVQANPCAVGLRPTMPRHLASPISWAAQRAEFKRCGRRRGSPGDFDGIIAGSPYPQITESWMN